MCAMHVMCCLDLGRAACSGVSLLQYDLGSVAQWISALDFGSKGRRFDPGQIRFLLLEQALFWLIWFLHAPIAAGLKVQIHLPLGRVLS